MRTVHYCYYRRRNDLKASSEVAELEQNIYLPGLKGDKHCNFITWEYDYKDEMLSAEGSFTSGRTTKFAKKYFYMTAMGN